MRLFVLLSRFPYPLERGDKLRAFHQLRILSQHHSICLCALHHESVREEWINELRPFCERIETIRLSPVRQFVELVKCLSEERPFQAAYFFNANAQKQVDALVAEWNPDLIYCQLLRTAAYVQHIKDVPKVVDFQDAFAKGLERRLNTDPWYLRPLLRSEMKRLSGFESRVFSRFDAATIISEQDRDQLSFSEKHDVHVVRNGVEMSQFIPSSSPKTEEVLFAGNMGYPPNVEAGTFLANEVMPLVWQRFPEARLMLAGARPTLQVRQLANDRITVTGWVDDMRDCYAKAKVFVAPMLIGTGLQNKLLEAMAMRLPCVTSPLSNNALGATPGKEVAIAETAEEFANAIISLLSNPDQSDAMAQNGHQFIVEHFSWEAQTEPLLKLMEKIGQNPQ